ncbi:MAG: phosphate ABC transporter ATP-binding protein PstB [Malacoplasma sp.]
MKSEKPVIKKANDTKIMKSEKPVIKKANDTKIIESEKPITNNEKSTKITKWLRSIFKKESNVEGVLNKVDFNNENVFEIDDFNFWYKYGDKQALFDINLQIKKNMITSFIGPSGCGKSTFISCLNRMNDLIDGTKWTGSIFFCGKNINLKSSISPLELRTKIGMVFQKPTPFPMSIYDNVAYGPKSNGIKSKHILDKIVEKALKDSALWDEVGKDLDELATSLSGGQQQRLCIARAIALEPEVLLMDEPTSALDPIATTKIEELILLLKKKYTIVIVTHSMAQAQRISDETVFFFEGKIIEANKTRDVFMNPREKKTKDYINGKIG